MYNHFFFFNDIKFEKKPCWVIKNLNGEGGKLTEVTKKKKMTVHENVSVAKSFFFLFEKFFETKFTKKHEAEKSRNILVYDSLTDADSMSIHFLPLKHKEKVNVTYVASLTAI